MNFLIKTSLALAGFFYQMAGGMFGTMLFAPRDSVKYLVVNELMYDFLISAVFFTLLYFFLQWCNKKAMNHD